MVSTNRNGLSWHLLRKIEDNATMCCHHEGSRWWFSQRYPVGNNFSIGESVQMSHTMDLFARFERRRAYSLICATNKENLEKRGDHLTDHNGLEVKSFSSKRTSTGATLPCARLYYLTKTWETVTSKQVKIQPEISFLNLHQNEMQGNIETLQ